MTDLMGMGDGDTDVIALHNGTVLQTHGPARCKGQRCVVHNPTPHPLVNAPLVWRDDRQPHFFSRLCEHDLEHPDPDGLAYVSRVFAIPFSEIYALAHMLCDQCDGCCYPDDE